MNAEAVWIRIGNRSDVEFERVVVKFPSQAEDYGRIPAGNQSGYRQLAKAYRYAHVEATVKGTTIAVRPIDYVGEQPLAAGKYTYALSYDPNAGEGAQLQVSLVKDNE